MKWKSEDEKKVDVEKRGSERTKDDETYRWGEEQQVTETGREWIFA